ncbi:MAG TPA: ATP-dependent helicase HrpB [Thermoanaerobaculia bacterium]|nr:ATP-dependent helicase HrpB [Thermoanaerobaculia bacterium]
MPPPPLPIDEILPGLRAAARERRALVVRAAPGAGKTTRIPPALLAEVGARVLVVEPRRVAARAAARRIAAEQGWELGREVGYQVRFERRAGPDTRLLVVTEGVALNLLQADPFLEGTAAVVFDEFHERNLASDLALALTAKVRREVRPELVVAVLSATLDPAPLVSFLGARHFGSEGREHPVEVAHLPRADSRSLSACVLMGVTQALERVGGDVLVFLPGVREIRDAADALEPIARARSVDLVPLYGDLPSEEQDRALSRGPRRRVILATNVAETSVTVEGVEAVVDSGLARLARFDPGCGLDRLEVVRISQASATQRAGRAGRLGPGFCLRLWTAAEQTSMPASTPPEIRRVDLAGAALQLLAWGESDLEAFPWFEAPEPTSLGLALELLARLGATRGRGVTELGRRMARLPLHPRIARLLLEGESRGCLERSALAAALLSERSPFAREKGSPEVPGTSAAPATRSDLLDRVEALQRFRRTGRGAETPWGRLHPGGARRVLAVADQLVELIGSRGRAAAGTGDEDAFLRSLLVAYPDRVSRRRELEARRGVMVGGRGVVLGPESGLVGGDLFVALDLDAGRRGDRSEARVRLASLVEESWLEGVRTEIAVDFDPVRERVIARERRLFADLVLAEREVPATSERAAEVLVAAARERLDRAIPLAEEPLSSFLQRLRCLRSWQPELGFPAAGPEDLAGLLPGLAAGKRSLEELRRLPWVEILTGLLSTQQREALEREAPERLAVPSGSRLRVEYEEGKPPVLAARIQELFGLAETPRVAGGQVAVLLHLLAPNGRPQQVTQDLASFWRNTYPEVRKELAGRYPKHSWPLDPWTAQPERRPGRPRRA